MKKIALSLLSLCMLSLSSFSQMKFGLKAGTNFSFVAGLPYNYDMGVGLNVGVLSQITINKEFLIQPELLYTIKGYRVAATGTHGKGYMRYNYISVPVMAGYAVTEKLHFLLGPEFNFFTKAIGKIDNITVDNTKAYNKFELGVGVGVTYIEVKGLGLEFRYSYGISKLSNAKMYDVKGNVLQNGGGHNHLIQAGLIYIFHK